MDHYNFRKNICQHWIDPDFKLIQKTSLKLKHVTYREATAVYDEITTLSGRTRGECFAIANKRKHTKAPMVTEKTLNASTGNLQCRLITDKVHLPLPVDGNGRTKCSLHRFVNRKYEYKKNVFECNVCRVPLCIHCFYIFHTVKSVSEIKKRVGIVVEENNHCAAVRKRAKIEK